jgi:hypothetical protein
LPKYLPGENEIDDLPRTAVEDLVSQQPAVVIDIDRPMMVAGDKHIPVPAHAGHPHAAAGLEQQKFVRQPAGKRGKRNSGCGSKAATGSCICWHISLITAGFATCGTMSGGKKSRPPRVSKPR